MKEKMTMQPYAQDLEHKRITMRKAMNNAIGHVMFALVILVGLLLLTMPQTSGEMALEMVLVYSLVAVIAIAYFVACIRILWILKCLNKVASFDAQEIIITCEKVHCMVMSVTKHKTCLFCVVFANDQGEPYYHILNKITSGGSFATKKWKQYKNHEIRLSCYKGTNIVKGTSEPICICGAELQ